MKLAGVVILYEPDENIITNLRSYCSTVGILYVIDNSISTPHTFITQLSALSHCKYLSDKDNKGIAARLNQAANMAFDDGYEWLLTMDQDSKFEDNSLHNYIQCIKAHPDIEKVAVFGVQFDERKNQSSVCEPVAVEQLITSGSIINLSIYRTLAGFDEALFIDQVDHDYCYQAILNHYRVIAFKDIFIKHSLGQPAYHYSLKNFNKTQRSLHSPIRLYYMVRNYLYIRHKYKGLFPDALANSRKDLLHRIKNNILYSSEKMKVVKYVFLGMQHYRMKRMGRL